MASGSGRRSSRRSAIRGWDFAEGVAPAQDASGQWGYIDRTGDYVIPPQFDQAYSFSEGLAGVQVGDKRGFITPDGTLVADPQFDDFWRHGGGIVPVRVGEVWGVIAPDATDPATRLARWQMAGDDGFRNRATLGRHHRPCGGKGCVACGKAAVHGRRVGAVCRQPPRRAGADQP